jgi:cytochrome c oxidase cbb3-type subunit IV
MDTYSFLRELADSWALLALTLAFLGVILWALRPGANALHRDAAASIFRNEKKPAGTEEARDPRAAEALRPVKEA